MYTNADLIIIYVSNSAAKLAYRALNASRLSSERTIYFVKAGQFMANIGVVIINSSNSKYPGAEVTS